jgi:hypothetical protein
MTKTETIQDKMARQRAAREARDNAKAIREKLRLARRLANAKREQQKRLAKFRIRRKKKPNHDFAYAMAASMSLGEVNSHPITSSCSRAVSGGLPSLGKRR